MKKIAVVLFNLGGPDSKEAIRPFLFNFFMDKNIIRAPLPIRFLVATMISRNRSKNEAGSSYAALGNKSPLLENSQAQAAALEKTLNAKGLANFKTFVSMRYWHPMAEDVMGDVRNWYADQIILLPLYPQFSTTTTRSSLGVWEKAASKLGFHAPTASVCCYPFNDGFIAASAANIRAVYEQAQKDGHVGPRLLFSAHGLPESVITDGDPYQWQCEQAAEKIAAAASIQNLDWAICYQSRVGPKKWIGPSAEEELQRAARDKKPVLMYPHAFTQEHVETLVEIEIEYCELAHTLGIPGFYRVPTVSTHPGFIEGLASIVQERIERGSVKEGIKAEGGKRICPENFTRCCMRAASVES
mgnify:FL=1